MALAEFYSLIKMAHVGLALTSGGLFAGRGIGVLLGATSPMSAPVRWLSMVVDSTLLLAALLLLATLGLNPFATPWLQAKLTLLVAYIVFGTLALKRAPNACGQGMGIRCRTGMFRDDAHHRRFARPARIPAGAGRLNQAWRGKGARQARRRRTKEPAAPDRSKAFG